MATNVKFRLALININDVGVDEVADDTFTARLEPITRPYRPAIGIDPVGTAIPVKVRVIGKRSDPNWGRSSLLLMKTTRHAVDLQLRAVEGGPDFSELVQSLLASWLKTSGAVTR